MSKITFIATPSPDFEAYLMSMGDPLPILCGEDQEEIEIAYELRGRAIGQRLRVVERALGIEHLPSIVKDAIAAEGALEVKKAMALREVKDWLYQPTLAPFELTISDGDERDVHSVFPC